MKFSPVPSVLVQQGVCHQKGAPDFFSSDPLEVRRAKNWCLSAGPNGGECPVRFACMEFATRAEAPETYGVWGGADQWDLRIACAVTPLGNPVKKSRPAKCPYCRSAKNVTEVREIKTRASQASCADCGLTWRRARSFVKKERVSRIKELAAALPLPRIVTDALLPTSDDDLAA